MKKLLTYVIALCALSKTAAQTSKPDTSINLDLLKAPVSPALNLLGVAPSDIERPTDINAFLVSLQNGTKNFVSFPKTML